MCVCVQRYRLYIDDDIHVWCIYLEGVLEDLKVLFWGLSSWRRWCFSSFTCWGWSDLTFWWHWNWRLQFHVSKEKPTVNQPVFRSRSQVIWSLLLVLGGCKPHLQKVWKVHSGWVGMTISILNSEAGVGTARKKQATHKKTVENHRTKKGRSTLVQVGCLKLPFFFGGIRGDNISAPANPASDVVRHRSWGSTMKNSRCLLKKRNPFDRESVSRSGWCFCLKFCSFFWGVLKSWFFF